MPVLIIFGFYNNLFISEQTKKVEDIEIALFRWFTFAKSINLPNFIRYLNNTVFKKLLSISVCINLSQKLAGPLNPSFFIIPVIIVVKKIPNYIVYIKVRFGYSSYSV